MPSGNALLFELGARLRALREARGWTLADLAERAGFGAAYLSEIERGRKNVPFLSLSVIASALGLPLDETLRGVGEERRGASIARETEARLPQHVEALARDLATLPAGRRRAVLAAVRAFLRAASVEEPALRHPRRGRRR